MSIHPDPEMDKAMRRWRERAEVAEAAHQASEEERIQAEKVANALATDLDNWKRDFSFQHQRADKAEAELARLRETNNAQAQRIFALHDENEVLWAAFKAADMAMRQSSSVEAAVEFGFRREEVKRVTGWPRNALRETP